LSSRVYRVLLIRSEPWTVSLIKELEKNNYSVQQTEFQRLSLVQAFRPDLVLLDLDYPTIDGVQTVGELRSLSKAPVIVPFTT
jgi:DNA-binding response OmpR family regulator